MLNTVKLQLLSVFRKEGVAIIRVLSRRGDGQDTSYFCSGLAKHIFKLAYFAKFTQNTSEYMQ